MTQKMSRTDVRRDEFLNCMFFFLSLEMYQIKFFKIPKESEMTKKNCKNLSLKPIIQLTTMYALPILII